jgi:hypothetical protein
MSTAELEEAFDLLAKQHGNATFAGRRLPQLISSAEEALGLKFPPTYRRFLLELGAGSFGGEEFYGVVNENFEDSAVPDGIWLTLDERAKSGLPPNLLIVSETGDGAWFALDTAQKDDDQESPVVIYFGPDAESPPSQVVARDFGEFFLDRVRKALARSATR